mgnify:CR=1 FL=1|jgi:ribosomal protein RSM22 (predicted rRNA methylase)
MERVGEIERHTVPKSQGRQIYYDARKARWGDTFPHEPKVKMLAPQGKEMEEVADKFGTLFFSFSSFGLRRVADVKL